LISQGVTQLGASNNGEMAKQVFIHTPLSRAYLALARLSCTSFLPVASQNCYCQFICTTRLIIAALHMRNDVANLQYAMTALY